MNCTAEGAGGVAGSINRGTEGVTRDDEKTKQDGRIRSNLTKRGVPSKAFC